VVAGRVDDPDRDVTPGDLDRKAEIAVVGDHDGRVDLPAQDVDQQVGGLDDLGDAGRPGCGTASGACLTRDTW
jgi:hypothetical protein